MATSTEDEPTEHERDKKLTSRRTHRAKNTSADAKLATWGDVLNQMAFGDDPCPKA